MDTHWSGRWVRLAVVAPGGLVALAAALGHWYRRELLEEGMRLVTQEHRLPAVRVLRRAVALSPGDARAHYYLGLAYADSHILLTRFSRASGNNASEAARHEACCGA
jgi:hypothetical protein